MKTPFQARKVEVDGLTTVYRLYEPPQSGGSLPIILFLHGAGESGSNDLLPTTVGLGRAISRAPGDWPALVVFPQASRGYGWSAFNLAAARAALSDVERNYDVDRRRVYVTGISMGGYGTWLAALLEPERFAAIVPICGGLDASSALRAGALTAGTATAAYEQAAKILAPIPQWIFHGDADTIIPVEESRAMVRALETSGAKVRYTEYPRVGHDSWYRAYAEEELPRWLFAQRL